MTSSWDVADEEQFFVTQADGGDETEEQIFQRKKQSREKATERVANQKRSSMKPSIKEFTKVDGNTRSYSMNGIKANVRIRIEQDADLVQKNLKRKVIGQPNDNVLLKTDRRFKHYKANEDRNILKDGLLFLKYYGETGSIKHYQNLTSQQLFSEAFRSLLEEFGKHPGITRTIIAYREKYNYPNVANLSGSRLCHVSNALQNHGLIADPPALLCKTLMSTLLRQKTPFNLTWCRNFLSTVGMKILWQPWACFPVIYLLTRNLIRTLKQLRKI